jgi:hypothetical protein
LKSSNPPQLPYFVQANFTNGTIKGFTTDVDVDTYTFELVGIDDSGAITIVQFLFTVKSKYFSHYNGYSLLFQMYVMLG